jgi:hypothetical protein
MELVNHFGVEESSFNPDELLKWLEDLPSDDQTKYPFPPSNVSFYSQVLTNTFNRSIHIVFRNLLAKASQPRGASGKACARLCALVEQSSKVNSSILRDFAFSKSTALELFDFYVEWNETEQHQSMRNVLDLLLSLITRNPSTATANDVRIAIMDTLISIISGKSTKPLLKSAIKSLDHLLNKSLFNLKDIASSYQRIKQLPHLVDDLPIWTSLFSELFSWMKFHYVCPPAGKLIVNMYRTILAGQETNINAKANANVNGTRITARTWNEWLLEAISRNPDLLESIKIYVLIPLFKEDRRHAFEYLQEINHINAVVKDNILDIDNSTGLKLAALEVGKKAGMVEEPGAFRLSVRTLTYLPLT